VKRLPARLLPVVASLVMAAAWAGPLAAAPPAWSSLTPQQQSVLAPLQDDWPGIDAARKQKWLELARRFPSLHESERERIQQRMADWARLTPSERGQARLQFQETRQISAEDRQARWEAYQALPDEQRRELAQRAKPAMKPASAAEPRTSEAAAKRNIVPAARQAAVKQVAPTLIQAKPGATTSLMTTKSTAAPSHQQPGLPKIAATPEFVDRNPLLPQKGPQGAAVHAPGSADTDAAHQ